MRNAMRAVTHRGQGFIVAGVAVAMLALVSGLGDLLRVATLLFALPVIATVIVLMLPDPVVLHRRAIAPRTAAGSRLAVSLELTNRSRWRGVSSIVDDELIRLVQARLTRGEPPTSSNGYSLPIHLAPGERLLLEYEFRPAVRGRYQVGPVTLARSDPFGLCRATRPCSKAKTVVVTPYIRPLATPIWRIPRDGDSAASDQPAPVGGEYSTTVHPYRHGDDMRAVHWRATARNAQLMVRGRERVERHTAVLFLDDRARAHGGSGTHSSFEWAVSATASISTRLTSDDYRVTLLTSASVHTSAEEAERESNVGILDRLATVDTTTTTTLATLLESRVALAERQLASAGVFVAILGAGTHDDLTALAAAKPRQAVGVALVLDTDSWTDRFEGASSPHTPGTRLDPQRFATSLSALGWLATPVAHGDQLSHAWQQVAGEPHLRGAGAR